jgi:hypothetical protein
MKILQTIVHISRGHDDMFGKKSEHGLTVLKHVIDVKSASLQREIHASQMYVRVCIHGCVHGYGARSAYTK